VSQYWVSDIPGQSGDEVDEKHGQITHPRIVAGRRNPKELWPKQQFASHSFCFQSERLLYGRDPRCCSGGTGKAEAAKLPDAGISLKKWLKKMSGRKRLVLPVKPTKRPKGVCEQHVWLLDAGVFTNVLHFP
jgi:hypothetical protein